MGLKNELGLAMVNKPSVFEPSRFDCNKINLYKIFEFHNISIQVVVDLCVGLRMFLILRAVQCSN